MNRKLEARTKEKQDFIEALDVQIERLMTEEEVQSDFKTEISRFIPQRLKERTIDNPEYWAYVQSEVKDLSQQLLQGQGLRTRFDMGV